MRRFVKRALDTVLDRRCRPAEALVLEGTAVVFAPHYDDDALGCGGTIIKRVARGAGTKVVFMTAGGKSHRHLMPEAELKRLRAAEAIAANTRIGLRENDLIHLGHEDGALAKSRDAAGERVAGILSDVRPDLVFVPYRREAPLDHRAATEIVEAAIARTGRQVPRYQYLVWFWNHWPRVPLELGSRRDLFRVLFETATGNYHLLRDFDRYVDVSDVLELKRGYLGEYRSQMTRLVDDEQWLTLGDVAGGEFLRCFFSPREYFARDAGG
jgi:LmbE family N-acetylglucosaminyl deacetylase